MQRNVFSSLEVGNDGQCPTRTSLDCLAVPLSPQNGEVKCTRTAETPTLGPDGLLRAQPDVSSGLLQSEKLLAGLELDQKQD